MSQRQGLDLAGRLYYPVSEENTSLWRVDRL